MPRSIQACLLAMILLESSLRAAAADETAMATEFDQEVQPFLKTHCLNCHGVDRQEGKLDLSSTTSVADVVRSHATWEIVLQRLEADEMPPADSPDRPGKGERQSIIRWLQNLRTQEANRNAGDPGIVLARRLSNAEYDNSIRDLTGFDLKPTKEFPIDPANESGFDNSGESLTMSPALLKKYLVAARLVADHVVLQPTGFTFASHTVVSETDRDKFCVQRIVDFYDRHKVNYPDYFLAAWEFQHRDETGRADSELTAFAEDARLSPKYLATLWTALHHRENVGPLRELQTEWAKLPSKMSQLDEARAGCETLSRLVIEIREDLKTPIQQLEIKGSSRGSQPLILWWNKKMASSRMAFPGDGDDAELDAARDRFCHVFPSAFSISSRGHYSDGSLGENVRLLSAGFHLMQGYFRDDQPLCELVLNESQRAELDDLWKDLNFVTLAPFRQYKDFLFFERAEPPQFAGGAEFDFARPEDKDVTAEDKLTRMRDLYIEKAKAQDVSDDALAAVKTYFSDMSRDFRWIERTHLSAEPEHLKALASFAERAWRRPLSAEDREDLISFYRELRDEEQLDHDDAIRDSIASVLMSPYFSFRFDLRNATQSVVEPSTETRPLSDYELASRLSYLLWASMPDNELLSHAAAGNLHDRLVLAAQTQRMLLDPKARGLATEFLGNWLEFRRFEEHNSVDRQRFPEFNSDLRAAMFEEPIHFFLDVARRDRSVLEFLSANHTFVNSILAKHYGMKMPEMTNTTTENSSPVNTWRRFDGASAFGRGGLLPMSVFLTKNSPGLRTSPVKRGYWVVRKLLGEHIPAPPPNVPELPKDEGQAGDLTLPELLTRHRDHAACVGCHQRFDSVGLAFEGFGPIGERRSVDLGGRPVQTAAVLPDGTTGHGLVDLQYYLIEKRANDFIDTLVRRMFVYALGRNLLLSDTQAIEAVKANLKNNEYRFGALINSIVSSPQFLNKRVR